MFCFNWFIVICFKIKYILLKEICVCCDLDEDYYFWKLIKNNDWRDIGLNNWIIGNLVMFVLIMILCVCWFLKIKRCGFGWM